MFITTKLVGLIRSFNNVMNALAGVGDLAVRIFIAKFFFASGLVKIGSWQQTVFLFRYEYEVPLIPYKAAAIMGTAAELVLPVLLVLGLAGRLSAFSLLIFNLVAVFSYPFLWTAEGNVGFMYHVFYGLLLMFLVLHGPGKIAIDTFIEKWAKREFPG